MGRFSTTTGDARHAVFLLAAGLAIFAPGSARAEGMLQLFNTSWAEVTRKMPEYAEAGYTSLWLPPPAKGSGGLSVGYDHWDPFDLGSRDQRGTVRTLYGTEAELIAMVETAHRFGIRVYFDNIMNHRAFDVPGYNEYTPLDTYPGMRPEDFHLRRTEEGFYRKWDNTRNWNDAWQVQNLGLADLIDIAHETPNTNFGTREGDTFPKIAFVRHPDHPEYYPDLDLPIAASNGGVTWAVYPFANKEPFDDTGYSTGGPVAGAGNGRFDWNDANGNGQHDAGEASEPFQDTGLDPSRPGWRDAAHGYGNGRYDMGNPVSEDVGAYLIRAARWFMDRTKADGLRLDAVKHVPDYFFGEFNSDTSGAGYLGGVQEQFNVVRGFSDWNNHRDTVFDTEKPRDDAMVFGEHLGEPPGYGGYIAAGMRLVDNPLRSKLNDTLGNPWATLAGLDQPGAGGFSPEHGVMHAQSHDSDYAARRELQHAFYFTRAGLPLVYSDGNYHAGTLGESGGAFPRHANTAFLGQWGDPRIPNLLHLHNQFARGTQRAVKSEADYLAYERLDKRENGGMSDADAVTMLVLINDNYSDGVGRDIRPFISFPRSGGTSDDAYLWQYARGPNGSGQVGFYKHASQLNEVVVPAGGYFIFAWRNPEESDAWPASNGGAPLQIYENGAPAGTVSVVRRDGPNGDPAYNPYGVADSNTTDYAYTWTVPRVTSPTNLSFVVRCDGSAENVRLKLDGGLDVNSHMGLGPQTGDLRDYPPGIFPGSTDTFLGYEQMGFVQRLREKFAATDTARNVIGSAGAETWYATIGTAGIGRNDGSGANSSDGTAAWAYHNPSASDAPGGALQLSPAPESAAGQPLTVWLKTGYQNQIDRAFLYYTTDGATWPEGAGGSGLGTTKVVPLQFSQGGGNDGFGDTDWWQGTIPALPSGAVLRWKIGVYHHNAASVFPANADAVFWKKRMLTQFAITNFNADNRVHHLHNDYATTVTNLAEGFHFAQARAFLKRDGKASIYETFRQTFYLDRHTPSGEIRFPGEGDTLGGQEYEAVVRADATVTRVLYNIADGNANNDDGVTGLAAGNGNGANAQPAWAEASEVTPAASVGAHPREFRFKYRNIPSSGAAQIRVRLLEISSSTNMALAPAAGHVAELTRNVTANAPDLPFFFDWPAADGTSVQAGYTVRVKFASALGNGFNDAQLRDSFFFEIRPEGDSAGAFQPRSQFVVARDAGGGLGKLEYDLPDLYDAARPDRLYALIVSQTNSTGLRSETAVKVKATPSPPRPTITIVEPVETDHVGNRRTIELPVGTNAWRQAIRAGAGAAASNVWVTVNGSAAAVTASTNNPTVESPSQTWWDFEWTITGPGSYRIVAYLDADGDTNTVEATDTVDIPAKLVERVADNPSDADDDDDGLTDAAETSAAPALPYNSDTWTDAQVRDAGAWGRTPYLGPDSDLDGLPDGLELGYRAPLDPAATDTNADTNADGWPNFIADLDPPFHNTLDNYGRVPGATSAAQGGDRRARVRGSATDPNNADTDYDGLPDGVEDANRNGWVDGDGASIPPSWDPWLDRNWPNGKMDPGESWTETDPNNPDTDGDGLKDGGEDANADGRLAGDANTNRVYDAGEEWSETNPLAADTDGDGLPDGWEAAYGFDALDNGSDSLRTAAAGDGGPVNGPGGNPDGDVVVIGGVTNDYTNLMEFNNGTHPRVANVGGAAPAGSISIGPGPALGTVNGRAFHEEFTDWTRDDLLALDEYEGDGPNDQGGDVYPGWDGFDSSRDLVAFYARDGGDIGTGGDGRLYFRADFHDLQAFAEEGNLNLYVVIDTGQPSAGERALPDDVDAATDMRWEAVVAVYDSQSGRVYVDRNPTNNSTAVGQDLLACGVEVRDGTHADGFKGAYFNSELDAVEFAISRRALTDAGWNGLDAGDLHYQVFTTKDGTGNAPVGAGDIGGRNDIRDSIYDDGIAEDYWKAQSGLSNTLASWFGRTASNDRGRRAKVAMVVHGNQAIQPANATLALINNGQGAGYHRLPAIHEIFRQPVNLHVTPTLASSLQWARADPAGEAWRLERTANGPLFNRWIADLCATGTVQLLGSTFSDHMLPYVDAAATADNTALASELLAAIYGRPPSTRVLWAPERLLDTATLGTIASLGYTHTLYDQMRHVWKWFGRNPALTDDGYRINTIAGVGCVPIHDLASGFLFANDDRGLRLPLRQLLGKKARAGNPAQLVTLYADWESFGQGAKADAYDNDLRWLANRPWVELVSLDDVAAGRLDLSVPPDGTGDGWNPVNRGSPALPLVAKDWVDHATQENYDNWYNGSAQEESLRDAVFAVRPGVNVPSAYGRIGQGGIASQAWSRVASVGDANLSKLARAALHASLFQTAFHDEDNHDLLKFSTGDYVWPDTSWNGLAFFARAAQSQTRFAAVYARVSSWAAAAAPLAVTVAAAADVDLDGEDEYLLYNDRVFLVFERLGGRAVGAWVRDVVDGGVYQTAGHLASWPGSADEREAANHFNADGTVGAYRVSLLKDQWATAGGGTTQYVNDVYDFTATNDGWRAVSSDGLVSKTLTLAPRGGRLEAAYRLSVAMSNQTLYVRNGLSPHLWDLLAAGDATLGPERHAGGRMTLANTNRGTAVSVAISYADAGHNASFNLAARDDERGLGVTNTWVNLRNLAHTHQAEVYGAGDFAFSLEFTAAPSDWDGDGIPNAFEDAYPSVLSATNAADAALDGDGDGVSNLGEYLAATRPDDPADRLRADTLAPTNGGLFTVSFPARPRRWYSVWYLDNDFAAGSWSNATPSPLTVPADQVYRWTDDGTGTTPSPTNPAVRARFYKVESQLPE